MAVDEGCWGSALNCGTGAGALIHDGGTNVGLGVGGCVALALGVGSADGTFEGVRAQTAPAITAAPMARTANQGRPPLALVDGESVARFEVGRVKRALSSS